MTTNNKETEQREDSKTVKVVFVSLLLDLLAFTMILPLFPALLEHYQQLDKGDGLYSKILNSIQTITIFIHAPAKESSVLFGGKYNQLFYFINPKD